MKILCINVAGIVKVSKLMGHNSLKTTEIYNHVRTKNIQQIKSPFDDLKKHILSISDLTSHILLTYIQLV